MRTAEKDKTRTGPQNTTTLQCNYPELPKIKSVSCHHMTVKYIISSRSDSRTSSHTGGNEEMKNA